MKYTLTSLKQFIIVTSLTASFCSNALDTSTLEKQADSSIKSLYHRVNSMPNTSMADRIDLISSYFKGQPYILGALGEGAKAQYDQFPKYRVDGFDCDTFVNTVLPLATASSLKSFQNCLKNTRYYHGIVSYITRNHFTSIDWNKNNQQRGLLKDITLDIKAQNNQPVALFAKATINKPGWYAHKTLATIRLEHSTPSKQEALLATLKATGSALPVTESVLPYLPLTALFKDNKPNLYLFSQIPSGAIIEIVRPNWDLRKQIGTSLNISHLGFAIRVKDQLIFRQASSEYAKVVDVPLIDYLQKTRTSPTIKGINVQRVLPTKPVDDQCVSFKN